MKKVEITHLENDNEGYYVLSETLARQKEFRWKIDDNGIHIIRKINKNISVFEKKSITQTQINELIKYLSKYNYFYLRNNVDKLHKNYEKEDGIGYFLYNELGWEGTDSQLASQIATIFCNSGCWENNGKKRNIKFNFCDGCRWEELILHHYNNLLNNPLIQMPINTIVVRPSVNHPEHDKYDVIVKNKLARGFAASCERIEQLPYIIVTDGFGQAILGNIVDVECEEPISVSGQRRVNITFDNVREPKNLFEKIHRGENNPNGIEWSSNNVRYIELLLLN